MEHDKRDNWIGLMSFGFFILLFALFFIVVPNYYTEVSQFLSDSLTLKPVPGVSNIQLPFPEDSHPVVYETVLRFCIIFGLFQFFVLALRLYFKSPVNKMAETISNIVIWLGAAYIFNLLFIEAVEWFPFLGGFIAVLGFSLIARSLSLLLLWRTKA